MLYFGDREFNVASFLYHLEMTPRWLIVSWHEADETL